MIDYFALATAITREYADLLGTKSAQGSGTVSPVQQNKRAPSVAFSPADKSVKYSPSEPCEYNHSLNPTAEDGVECGKDGTYREDLEIVLCDRHYKEMK